MNKLIIPSVLKEILNRHGFRFSKSLGQNFLIDGNILDKIISACDVDNTCGILEIGAGAGVLTCEMAKNAKKVVSVEIDKSLIPILNENLSEYNNVKLVCDDILKIDIKELIDNEFEGINIHVAANLPYYITTPIIMKVLEGKTRIKSITVMVQKEVAERICANPGGKDYGALSAAVRYYAVPRVICKAEPHCFMPQPKVASVVVHMEVLDTPAVNVKSEEVFFKVVRAAFGQRRKTLVNALIGSGEFGADKAVLNEILEQMGLSGDIRGERLSVEQFAQLANLLVLRTEI